MKEPTTEIEIKQLHIILKTDPQQFLQVVNQWLVENPCNVTALFERHMAWMTLGEPRKALADMDAAIKIAPHQFHYISRAAVLSRLGEYAQAIEDLSKSEAPIPDEWEDLGFGLLQQADCYARLGNEAKALECCARLQDDFWTPGLYGAPAGDKIAIAPQLKLIANEANRNKKAPPASGRG